MSRHTQFHNGYYYAYGKDHVLGWFFEKYKETPERTIQIFDISEFVAFIPHPDVKATKNGLHVSKKVIAETIMWEIENNQFPMNKVIFSNLIKEIPENERGNLQRYHDHTVWISTSNPDNIEPDNLLQT